MPKWRPTPPPGGDVPRGEFDNDEPSVVGRVSVMEARLQRLELRDANHFGVEGADGAWQRHEEEDKTVHKKVDVLDGFRTKFLVFASLGGILIGVLAEVASHLIGKALG